VDENDLKAELGDLLWFCAEYCTAQGWDMEQICVKNIEKLRARYPKGFSAERSLHREQ
jgi:NTP pyrophosphatase (non-canonical NTP hydrolase)